MSEETPNPVSEAAKHNGRLGGLTSGAKRRAAKGQEAAPIAPDVAFDPDLMAKYRKEFARQGGLKGGVARGKILSDERKREIGRLGGLARWGKHL